MSSTVILLSITFLVINAAAFAAFGLDKMAAKEGERRIAESTLLSLALVGGTLGSLLGQRHFRHKTRKQPFKFQLYTIVFLHMLGIIYMINPPFWLSTFAVLENLISENLQLL